MSYTPPTGPLTFSFSEPANPTASPVLFKFGALGVILAVAAQVLSPVTQTATMEVLPAPIEAQATQVTESVVQSAVGAVRTSLTASQTLGSVQQAATATVSDPAINFQATQTLEGVSQVASFTVTGYFFTRTRNTYVIKAQDRSIIWTAQDRSSTIAP